MLWSLLLWPLFVVARMQTRPFVFHHVELPEVIALVAVDVTAEQEHGVPILVKDGGMVVSWRARVRLIAI